MKNEKAENPVLRSFKGMLWCAAGEFVCVIFNLCMLILMRKMMIMKLFTGIASLIITNGLFFNFTYNCAVRDRNLIKYHNGKSDRFMGMKLAVTAPLPQYILWIVLLISKLSAEGDFFRYYILADIQCLAWVDLFTESRDMSALSYGGLFGLLAITLVAPVVIMITYSIVVRDIDVKARLVYGKKDR